MTDKLAMLQGQASRARDLSLMIDDLQQQIASHKEELNKLQMETMPSLMDELKLDHIGVPPLGNKPGVDYELNQVIGASISTKWPPEKLSAAFDTLKKYEAESLIKTEVSAKLPKGSLKVAKQLVAAAKKLNVTAELTQSVHGQTLSAWLRDIYKGGQSLPQSDLEKIGGYVGRMVKAKERES